jgi:hypothetical protein
MQDRPEAYELLGQLAAWLATDLIEHVPREQRFGVRVAANVAAICARELAPGAPDAAEAIRAGKLDAHLDEAREVVRDSVRAKLAVARPDYAAWEEPAA